MRFSIIFLLFATISWLPACRKITEGVDLKTVTVQLMYPVSNEYSTVQGVKVTLKSRNTTVTTYTNENGKAIAHVPIGIYDITASEVRPDGLYKIIFNGLNTNVIVGDTWNEATEITVSLVESRASQVIIKELFSGGTPRDDGSGYFGNDKYIILYNNSDAPADISKLCFAAISPYNANASNAYYDAGGKLLYEAEQWIPAVQAFWYFENEVILQPWQQIVVAINGAIDHTLTYSKSVNLANADYYCMYDKLNFTNASAYPAPSFLIPTSHYLKSQKYSTGNAWTVSVNSPGIFIFNMENTTPQDFVSNPENAHTVPGYTSRKVPFDWVIDALEAFVLNDANNKKRFPAAIDAGAVELVFGQGYSIYRNVDKEATEAISTNNGKLVYNYSLGTTDINGTTDPSGIDAEASIKNGAIIVYSDKNNSTTDFHLRSKASLRTN